jgi:hypothetical protein
MRKAILPATAAAVSALLLAVTPAAMTQAASEASAPAASATAAAEPATIGGQAGMRRLNEAQYKQSIEDIFGAGITVPGRFDPPLRDEGLLAIGDGKVGVSASGLEQYELRAREIAAQVLGAEHRAKVLTCAPKSTAAFDRACASAFFSQYGRLLFRRPLSEREMASTMALAEAATALGHDPYKGLEAGLSRLIGSPHFIFRVERSEIDPARSDARRLDGFSLASRISFLLWDAPPDAALLDAAASGALHDPALLNAQVDRMIASPRFEHGVRAFFSDMFAYEQFDGLTKDQAIYPKYTSQLAKDAKEQALLTIIDLLVTGKGDYRDLFTTKKTFMNRSLGSLYRVPFESPGVSGWVPYSFAAQDPRAGLLSLAGFLMLDPTHEGRSSPTIRGKTVRELFLCQPVPPAPANVNFTIVQDIHDPVHRTARQRLAAHADDPSCSGCHKITDPIGLSMENYDAVGAWRTHENDTLIDASGSFEGHGYRNLLELQNLLHGSSAVPACLVQRTFEYGVGRQLTDSEGAWLDYASTGFAADSYQFPALLRRIATSRAFQAVSPAGDQS